MLNKQPFFVADFVGRVAEEESRVLDLFSDGLALAVLEEVWLIKGVSGDRKVQIYEELLTVEDAESDGEVLANVNVCLLESFM